MFGCVFPFIVLAALLWVLCWMVVKKARRGRDQGFQHRLQDLLEEDKAPQVGHRASVGLWILAILLALGAFATTLCTGAVLFGGGMH